MSGATEESHGMTNTHMKKGVLLAFATAIISGFAIFYNKTAAIKGIDPVIFNIIKNGGVALVLSAFLFISQKDRALRVLSNRDWLKLFAIGIVGGSLPFILFFTGLKMIPAVNASMIHKTLFVWVALMVIPLLKERFTPVQLGGYVLILLGNFVIGGFKGFSWNLGELLVLTATVLWAVENIIAKIALKNIDSVIVSWARMFIGTCFLILIAAYQNKLHLLWQFPTDKLFLVLPSVGFLTAYVATWYTALKNAPATIVSSILVFATVITNVLSVVFITHSFPLAQLESSALIVLGVTTITYIAFKKVRVKKIFTKA